MKYMNAIRKVVPNFNYGYIWSDTRAYGRRVKYWGAYVREEDLKSIEHELRVSGVDATVHVHPDGLVLKVRE